VEYDPLLREEEVDELADWFSRCWFWGRKFKYRGCTSFFKGRLTPDPFVPLTRVALIGLLAFLFAFVDSIFKGCIPLLKSEL
tara:strand:+ start:1756 stop:2001 length:246 start_codon:yes stop_codon:yes gene_type:complete